MGKEIVTLPIVGQFVVFNELMEGDNLLFFYDRDLEARQILQSALNVGLKNNQVCFCAFDRNNSWAEMNSYEENNRPIFFPLSRIKHKDAFTLEELADQISNIHEYAKNENAEFKLMIDFGNLVDKKNLELAIGCENEVVRKISELKRHCNLYKNQCRIVSAVTAFNIQSLDAEAASRLLNLPKKITVFLRDRPNLFLPNFVLDRQSDFPPIDTVSHESMEKFTKNNLEMIVLFMLKEKPMSGFDIVKSIASKYHVYLNQGNVYPLLYSFTSNGILDVRLGSDNRAKLYSLSEEAEENISKKLEEFSSILNHFMRV